MPSNWTKGYTKYTHPSIMKISKTMKQNGIDNFAEWRLSAKKSGILKSEYPSFDKDGDLAELLGVIYGDGNIEKFPRTERLVIAANARNPGFIKRYSCLIQRLFKKQPRQMLTRSTNCLRISIYEKYISNRLKIPTGNKSNLKVLLPTWVKRDHNILIRFLRGLFEAEGSFCVHRPTGTYKLLFSNKNRYLLNIVQRGLIILGFHPNLSGFKVQLSRKKEVDSCIKMIKFRHY